MNLMPYNTIHYHSPLMSTLQDKISNINNKLQVSTFTNDAHFNTHVEDIRQCINDIEADLYDTGMYDKNKQKQIKEWRHSLYKMIQNKTSYVKDDIPDILTSTVSIVNRQINKIDINNKILEKGTIKLLGLDYTNKDIEQVLRDTRQKILKDKNVSSREIRVMYLSFIMFCMICMFILLDKFVLKL